MSETQTFCRFCREPVRDDGYGEMIHEVTGKYIAADSKGKEHAALAGGKPLKKVKP